MTEERNPMPAEESTTAAVAAKQRKKRKWDQPAESLISAGFSVTATLPLGTSGIVGIPLPGTILFPSAVITNPVPANSASASLLFQSSSVSQNPATVVQNLTQPKIQDELIAREIVINDAEPTVRYKLTKRQTQEEIQRSTGAVVITRGKYRSPDALPDSEKPLYLHISAGAHLKDTAERIKAVDHAAYMIEDILKQGQSTLPAAASLRSAISNGQATQLLSSRLFLGFETDPLLNIAARIRGPNDQYINHIMNETGATVVLRGKGSGNIENISVEEAQQPLHLYLSSANPKSLEAARILGENLLDTISAECGASRNSTCKVYSAVPPPPHLLSGVQGSGEALGASANPVAVGSMPLTPSPAPNGATLPSGCVPNYLNPQPHVVSYPYSLVTGGTSYSGYGGIYPQATPLQQVALALKKAPAALTPALVSTASAVIMSSKPNSSSTADTEKQPPQKRKFQELPVALKETMKHHQVFSLTSEADRLVSWIPYLHVSQGLKAGVQKYAVACLLHPNVKLQDLLVKCLFAFVQEKNDKFNLLQGSECLKPGFKDSVVTNGSTMPPPKKLARMESDAMPPPPPPRNMPPPPPKFAAYKSPPPPPPPKFVAPQVEQSQDHVMKKSNDEPVSDTLLKLVEYGEEDDDDIDLPSEEHPKRNLPRKPTSKPFWAV